MADDDLGADLLGYVWHDGLPAEVAIMRWMEHPDGSLKIRAHDHALLIGRGASTIRPPALANPPRSRPRA